jgi:hypothetical protein
MGQGGPFEQGFINVLEETKGEMEQSTHQAQICYCSGTK